MAQNHPYFAAHPGRIVSVILPRAVPTFSPSGATSASSGAIRNAEVRHEEGDAMSSKKVWFITGAGRGMGVDFAKAALAAGHAVVATGRNSVRVSQALGRSNDLLAVKLDVTNRADAEAAAQAA